MVLIKKHGLALRAFQLQAWCSMGIKVKGCLLMYEGAKSCEVCTGSQSTALLLHHGARYIIPFSKEFQHFEVRKE